MSALSVSWLRLSGQPLSQRVGNDMAMVTPEGVSILPQQLEQIQFGSESQNSLCGRASDVTLVMYVRNGRTTSFDQLQSGWEMTLGKRYVMKY